VRNVEAGSPPSGTAADEDPVDAHEVADASEPVTAERPPEPLLASAPVQEAEAVTSREPVLSEVERATVVAVGPRTTMEAETELSPARPSELEAEMATGVVAGMVLDQFVAEHMVESSSTLLSVVTDTPTSELGPVITEDENEPGSFGFSFTDAMRRALTESENQLP
jgi:hypothetical protein